MTEAQMDHAQTFIQLASLCAIAFPICCYAAYWVALQPDVPSNGRNKYWYTAYGTLAAFILFAFLS